MVGFAGEMHAGEGEVGACDLFTGVLGPVFGS